MACEYDCVVLPYRQESEDEREEGRGEVLLLKLAAECRDTGMLYTSHYYGVALRVILHANVDRALVILACQG